MSKRYGEWDLFDDYTSDPVPASRLEVRDVAGDMSDRSKEASDIHDVLKKLSDLEGWRGKTAEAFAEKADEVLGDLDKVEDRYDKVAKALYDWAEDVDIARDETWKALKDAEAAGKDDKEALDKAKTKLTNAMGILDDAAGDAENAIDDAADVWDDGMWGNVKGWIRDHADLIAAICDALKIIAAILGAIILVCAIVASAPFALIVAAIVVGALILAADSAQVLADTGKADWKDVAMDAVGLALTCVGGSAAKSAMTGLKSLVPQVASRVGTSAKTTALSRLIGSSRTQFNNALKIRNPANNLARWASGIKSAAAGEGEAAATRITNLLNIKPGNLKIALTQDRDLSLIHSTLGALRNAAPTIEESAQIASINAKMWAGITSGVAGNVSLAHDLPGNIDNAIDFVKDPPWSTQPTH